MIKLFQGLLVINFLLTSDGYGQITGSGLNYQMTMISNPSVTGSAGDGLVRLSYLNYYPGNNYNLHSVCLSYDGYFPSLHGGAGFFLSDDYLGGIVNDLKGGFSYAYFFRASNNLYISAGLSASFYHRGYSFSNAILPDQIDPIMGAVLPSGEALSKQGKTIFDLATGFLFISGRIFGGISVSHLTEPDPGNNDFSDGKLRRQLLIHASGDFDISREKNLKISPLMKLETREGLISSGLGAALESKYLSVNIVLLADNGKNFDLQTGFSITSGPLIFLYNYRFNIVSGENLLPVSILHHTGIAFSLNNVDKRKTVKTINFPKL
jgi:type IX secretion system PorP/SprF family membrane protein